MKRILLVLGLTTALISQFSCKKENDSIGLNSNSGSLQSASIDSFQLTTYSKYSQNTSSNSGTSVFIGGYHTRELGTMLTSTYTSLAPTDLSFRIPEGGVTVNSVSLTIRVIAAYGNPFSQDFKVSKTATSVAKEASYLSSDSLTSENNNLGNFTLENNDTGTVNIALEKSFGEEIISIGDVIFTTSEMFIDLFKGISIRPSGTYATNTGSVYTIDADEIILSINYSENISGNSGTVSFSPTSNARSFYNSSFDRSGSEVDTALSYTNSGNTNFLVQGLGSIKSAVEIPSALSWFKSGNYLINKAIITVPVSMSVNGNFYPPTSLTVHKASDGSSEGIQAIFDATNNQYVFDIESLLSEKLIAGEEANFELSVLNSYAHPEQVKLNGSSNSTSNASLIIHYTEY